MAATAAHWLRRLAPAAALTACLPAAAQDFTAPPEFTVFAAGDIAHCNQGNPAWSGAAATARIVEAGLAGNPHAAVLLLGDITYPRGTAADFSGCYHPTWGRFKDRTYPSPGNHEYLTPGASGYFGYFGAVAAKGYFRVKLGSWQVYSLDSNLAGAAAHAQLDWLRAELAANPAHCTLAYWHHPLYSSGGHASMGAMRAAWEILQAAGAELVLSGHDHDYERFAPQDGNGRRDDARGMRQFVVGTGGAYLTPFLWPVENSEVRDNSRTGVLKLMLRDDGYRWQFLEAASDGFPNGPAPDQGEASCR